MLLCVVLGRDDRLVSDAGREARHPFLDEPFVTFVRALPLDLICDLSMPPGFFVFGLVLNSTVAKCMYVCLLGVGDKRILRLAAHRLGLSKACSLVKRAMQFGSRIANNKGFLSRSGVCICHAHVAVSGEVEMDDSIVLAEIVHPALLTVSLPRGPLRLQQSKPDAEGGSAISGAVVRHALSKKVKRREREQKRVI